MNPKPIIIAICCVIAIVVGVYFGGRYILEKDGPDGIPVTSTEKNPIPAVEQKPEGKTLSAPLHADANPHEVPQSDTSDEYVTMTDKVAASEDVPSREAFRAMGDEELVECFTVSYEKARLLSPEVEKRTREWGKVVSDLTRHAKNREENDAILAAHADKVKPLKEAMYAIRYEYLVHQITGRRAFKEWHARAIIEDSKKTPEAGTFHVPPESLTEDFWTQFWNEN